MSSPVALSRHHPAGRFPSGSRALLIVGAALLWGGGCAPRRAASPPAVPPSDTLHASDSPAPVAASSSAPLSDPLLPGLNTSPSFPERTQADIARLRQVLSRHPGDV